MKRTYNSLLFLLACLIILFGFLTSCEDDEGSTGEITLESFGPSPLMRGGELRFIGTNLDQVTSIILPENVEVTSFVTRTSDLIVIEVPVETEPGYVTLKTPQGDIETKTLLSLTEPITITSISPSTVRPNDIVTIEGTYLNLVAEVVFADNISVTEFESQSNTTLKVKVPYEAQTGTLTLVDGEEVPNRIKSDGEVGIALPLINSLSPEKIRTGSNLTVSGTNLDLATALVFEGGARVDSAVFLSQSSTEIVFTVPADAQLGKIKSVAASQVETASTVDLILVQPVITKISPDPAKPGGTITVTGTDLDLITGVTFGGDKAGVIDEGGSAASINVDVPSDATDGVVNFTTDANQSVESPAEVKMIVPAITSFSPATVETEMNPSITITGTNLDIVTKVIFAGDWEAPVSNATETEIVIPVTAGSVSGKFKLITTNGAEVQSSTDLTIIPYVPHVTSAPEEAYIGSIITLTGTDMNIPADVILPHNIKATLFGTKNATTLEVYIPENVTAGEGKIKFVTNKNEVYESPSIIFKFPGVEPVSDKALVINDFDEAGHDLGWDNWAGNVELGNDASVAVSGKYLHGTNANTNGWTWIWGCNHAELKKVSVTTAGYLLKMDVRITKNIPGSANFQMNMGGNTIDLGNLGGSTPNNGWITITYDLSSFSGLPATIPDSGTWGMILSSGSAVDITGLYVDNIRFHAK